MTEREHIAKYMEFEKLGKFNDEINPIDWDACYPVTEKFDYIPKSPLKRMGNFFKKTFLISPYAWYKAKIERKIKIVGRENLKGIKSAIVTCNHVYIYDCLMIRYALKKYRHKYAVAEFNNRKGFLGNMMRADGILPLSGSFNVLKKFSDAVGHYLSHKNFVVFYPEQSMWHMYEKPRPFKNGAFHYASKFGVPIIPMFITYRNSGKFDSEGLEFKYFTLHILKPIYPDPNLSKAENIEQMRNSNFEMCKAVYEETYKKKLSYES